MNLYSYAGNNPVSFSDPFGLCPRGNCTQSERHYEVDAAGDDFIKTEEKFKSKPYDDGANHLTIGYGHKILGTDDFPSGGITEADASALYESDKGSIIQPRLDQITNPSLNQNQVNALGSYIFNAGGGRFHHEVLPSVNAGNLPAATDAMAGASAARNKKTGAIIPLTNRRQHEIDLFNTRP